MTYIRGELVAQNKQNNIFAWQFQRNHRQRCSSSRYAVRCARIWAWHLWGNTKPILALNSLKNTSRIMDFSYHTLMSLLNLLAICSSLKMEIFSVWLFFQSPRLH